MYNQQPPLSERQWEAPAVAPLIESDQVHVWLVPLDAPPDLMGCLWMMLDAGERGRAAQFALRRDQERYVMAHAALRAILARYLGSHPSVLRFSRGAYGKPALIDTRAPELRFNLTHSDDLALCAVTPGREVGIDIERIRAAGEFEAIAQHLFSTYEQAELRALPQAQRRMGFFTCWTRKEAYLKARGEGVSLPLTSFDVSLRPVEPAVLLNVRHLPGEAARWSLRDLSFDRPYAGAVAAEGADWTLRQWLWSWHA